MNRIITIGREFGSGGRELGHRLSEELGFAYYDQEIIREIAQNTSLSEHYVQSVFEGNPYHSFPIHVGMSFSNTSAGYVLDPHKAIYAEQSRLVMEIAGKSDCIIVGRCADQILSDMNPIRIFVYADMESKIRRCRMNAGSGEYYDDKQLQKLISKINRNRRQYYEFYTGHRWGDKSSYDLMFNTSNMNIGEAVGHIASILKAIL